MSDIQQAIGAAEAQAATEHAEDELAAAGIVFQDWCGFMVKEPPPFDWVVSDVIAKGMKGDLNAKSKQWKSFFGMQLASCVSTGRPFLNMQVPQARRTVYFNLEIIERGAWERGTAMSAAMDATPVQGMLYIVNLRGKVDKLREHTPALVAEVRRLGINLVVLDPRYKLIEEGEDENSAAGLRGVLQFRDALAEAADPDPASRADEQAMRPRTGTRLPGVRRFDNGRLQRLLYLNPEAVRPTMQDFDIT